MGTPLGQQSQPGHPSIKLRAPGQYVDFHVVDITEVPRYEFGTRNPKLNQQGQPMKQHRVTALVAGGTGHIPDDTGPDGAERVVRAGDVAIVYIAGRDKWDPDLDKTRQPNEGRSWGGAVDTLPDKQLCCGDVVRWTYEGDVQGQGAQPRKIRTFRLRRPRPDEAAGAQRAEELRLEVNRTPIGAPAGGGGYGVDEEPF
jgi:hypothetical protein